MGQPEPFLRVCVATIEGPGHGCRLSFSEKLPKIVPGKGKKLIVRHAGALIKIF